LPKDNFLVPAHKQTLNKTRAIVSVNFFMMAICNKYLHSVAMYRLG
jgi:hypothetical protein